MVGVVLARISTLERGVSMGQATIRFQERAAARDHRDVEKSGWGPH